MNTCLKNIVSIKDLCSVSAVSPSLSGYDIWMAPEIRYQGIAAITDEKYIRGRNLLLAKRDMALLEVESDFLKMILTNGYGIKTNSNYNDAAVFNSSIINPEANVERGISIHSARPSGIRKIHIKDVKIYPLHSVEKIQLNIWDNGQVSKYDIQLIGGQVNTFYIDYLATGDLVRIFMDNTGIPTYSSKITCMVGCNGSLPNDCAYVKGWNGTNEVKSEGFGISASFNCECNYSSILCQLAKQFVGEIVFYKIRALVQEELLNTDRLNNFTIYNRDQAKAKFSELENIYREKWNSFALALPEILKSIKDDCIVCKQPKWTTNV